MASTNREEDATVEYLHRSRKTVNIARVISLVLGIVSFMSLLVVEVKDSSRILSALGRFFTTLSFLPVIANHGRKEKDDVREQDRRAVRIEVARPRSGSGSTDTPSRGWHIRVCWYITKAHILGLEENASLLDILQLALYVLGMGSFLALTVLQGERAIDTVSGIGATLVSLPVLISLVDHAKQGTEEDHGEDIEAGETAQLSDDGAARGEDTLEDRKETEDTSEIMQTKEEGKDQNEGDCITILITHVTDAVMLD